MAQNTFNQTSPISEITSEKASWTVIARVIRMWVVNDFNPKSPPFSVEMVLIDRSGCRIHATMKRTLLYKFRALLVEDRVYSFQNMSVGINGGAFRTTKHPFKQSFQFASRVVPVPGSQVRVSPFEFVPICDIVGGIHNTDFLVDVIGLLSGIGTEREWEKNGVVSKLNEIEIESDGKVIDSFFAYMKWNHNTILEKHISFIEAEQQNFLTTFDRINSLLCNAICCC